MRRLIIFIFFFHCCILSAQPTKNIIEYKGGKERFSKDFGKYLDRHKGVFSDLSQVYTTRTFNKYFTVLMEIDKSGVIGDNIIINSYNDTTVISVIIAGLRETSGNWVNYSGISKWVVLPIYYIYDDGAVPLEKVPLIKEEMYTRNGKADLIYLEKYEIILYPSVH